MVSLGCAKNRVDSEIILGYVEQNGHEIVSHPEKAHIIIVNTCGFIGPAKEESIDTILEMAEYKEKGNCRGLIVTGCLSGRYSDELLKEMPEIDGLLGTNELDKVPLVIEQILAGEKVVNLQKEYFLYEDTPRVLSTGRHSAYLKIAEGCNHQCSFCVIPKIRGPYRSRTPESIVKEAQTLIDNGVKELNIIAQDTTKYGQDRNDTNLTSLLRQLTRLPIPWIRVLYTYPTHFTDELIDLWASTKNLVNYVDIPLQHASQAMLRKMGRPGDFGKQLRLIDKLHRQIPDVSIRSSFIVGFPGETDRDFLELLEFLRQAKLDHVGIFKYSPEEDTTAYSMEDQISEELKAERYQQAMAVQQAISQSRNERYLGKKLTVLIEGQSPESELVLVGRHQGQAPEVDGVVYIGNKYANAGELVIVKITEVHPYDLVGEIVEGENNWA